MNPDGFAEVIQTVHYYYGDGKGKTSAAVGACIRAAGNGLRCAVIQFLKNGSSGEVAVLRQLGIPVYSCTFQDVRFFREMNAAEQQTVINEHNANLRALLQIPCGMIVLDELGDAIRRDAVDAELVREMLSRRDCEIIVTGHTPVPLLLSSADYITEFRCAAHPFRNGLPARKGIEY